MKNFFETIAVAFGMFSRIPVPQVTWTEENKRYSMLAFPAIGLAQGVLWMIAVAICRMFDLPELLTGALLTALPLLVVGGIHLDGYGDTVDALSSHADKEKKLEIMKDPHVGSFAVMHYAVYFLIMFASCTALAEADFEVWVAVGLTFVLSRALSGLAVATFPMAKTSGLAASFANDADKKNVRNGLIFLLVVLALAFIGIDLVWRQFPVGFFGFLASVAVFFWYRYIAEKHFGGINGDLAGWFLSKCELWAMVAMAAATSFV